MKFYGIVTGLTPKEKVDSEIIEIKIVTKFDQKLLADLAAFFGKEIVAEINQQQPELEEVEMTRVPE